MPSGHEKGRCKRMITQRGQMIGTIEPEVKEGTHGHAKAWARQRGVSGGAAFSLALFFCLAFLQVPSGWAQSDSQNSAPKLVAGLNDPAPASSEGATNNTSSSSADSSGRPAGSSEAEIPPAVAKQLEEMEKRIEELEAALKARDLVAQPAANLLRRLRRPPSLLRRPRSLPIRTKTMHQHSPKRWHPPTRNSLPRSKQLRSPSLMRTSPG